MLMRVRQHHEQHGHGENARILQSIIQSTNPPIIILNAHSLTLWRLSRRRRRRRRPGGSPQARHGYLLEGSGGVPAQPRHRDLAEGIPLAEPRHRNLLEPGAPPADPRHRDHLGSAAADSAHSFRLRRCGINHPGVPDTHNARSEPGHGDSARGELRGLLGQTQGSQAAHEPRSLIRVPHKCKGGHLSVVSLGGGGGVGGFGRRPDSTTATNFDRTCIFGVTDRVKAERSLSTLKSMLLK